MPVAGAPAPAPAAAPAARPFIKWAGGKKQLLAQILPHVPSRFNAYHEPFLGGGALFFALRPQRAWLSDGNQELIDTYRAVQTDVEAVIRGLRSLYNDEEHFYRLRAIDPARLSLPARAARFIYINRTCFNGLYRVNRAGQFNVPFGRYLRPTICNALNLRSAADALRGQALDGRSFENVEARARPGDLVYFDPPYVPASKTANFVGYTAAGFCARRQEALASLFSRLVRRGVHALLSNADTPWVRELYRDYVLVPVRARRAINCRPELRQEVGEVLVVGTARPAQPIAAFGASPLP